jgi:hypothetical protein
LKTVSYLEQQINAGGFALSDVAVACTLCSFKSYLFKKSAAVLLQALLNLLAQEFF